VRVSGAASGSSLRGLWLAALLLACTTPALAQKGCPAALATELAAEAPICQLHTEGTLTSTLGNGDVSYRLYRWVSAHETEPLPLHDSTPYNNSAVTLSLAATPDRPPFWSSHYWPGIGWFDTPYLARHAKYGEFLVIPGRYAGTGSFTDDHVFMPRMGRGWTPIRAGQTEDGGAAPWVGQLIDRLPPGLGIWKGIRIDYTSLTGTTAVWRDGDANCCPSGGELWFRLRVTGPEPGFAVAEARYTLPAE
jgi:hypothetical protein